MTQTLTATALWKAVRNKRPALKNELVHRQRYATRDDAKAAIQKYIESFYNRQWRHARLGNVPPALFAENFNKKTQAT